MISSIIAFTMVILREAQPWLKAGIIVSPPQDEDADGIRQNAAAISWSQRSRNRRALGRNGVSSDGMKREPLSVGILVLSTACRALAATLIIIDLQTIPFGFEVVLCAILVYACSGVSFLANRTEVFLLSHATHGVLTILAIAILSGEHRLLESLFFVPFLAESTVYLSRLPTIIINALIAVAILAIDSATLYSRGLRPVLLHDALVLLVATATTASGCAVTRYREMIVRSEKQVRDLRSAVSNLASANRAFQSYADRIEAVSKDDERSRITRELHDVVGSALTNIMMMMNASKALAQPSQGQLPDLLEHARSQADRALQESRRILYQLRSMTTPPREGIRALAHLVRSFNAVTGINVEIHYGNLAWSYGEHIDGALFRLIQEGLTNSFQHGSAHKVRIMLWRSKTDIQVRVWDDGTGSKSISDGIGLSGMKERFAALGGQVKAYNVLDGFILEGFIPVGEEFHESGNDIQTD